MELSVLSRLSGPQVLLAIYYLILGTLAAYGVHRLALVALYYRTRHRAPGPAPVPAEWPRVTVQLPLFNEMYVAERLIRAVAQLDYPRDRLEIQVLDDSTDETRWIVARQVELYRQQGLPIRHLHRLDRTGFKAGALAAGQAEARGELVAVLDADFVPRPDFLRRAVPHFDDPGVGMVQARWEHINRHYSLLTRIQAVFLDGHFIIEHAARNRAGMYFNFNGTAGVWRREAIDDAGGWQHDTLTEDLDLSYRAQLAGWQFRFLSDVTAPAELPVEINAFKRQQFRWAKGSIQTARKLLGRLLRAPVSLRVKAEAFVHLTNNASYLLMVGLSILVFPAMLIRRGDDVGLLLLLDLPMFLAATVSVLVFYAVSQRERGGRWGRELLFLPALMGVGIGLAVNNSRAVVSGILRRGGVFERTPKYRIENRRDGWRGKRYRVAHDSTVLVEGLLAVYFTCCFAMAVRLRMWPSLPFLYLFLQGHAYMFLLSVLPARRFRRDDPVATRPLGSRAETTTGELPPDVRLLDSVTTSSTLTTGS
jgi:cellulose synthase/poly-beta-1,6-N-acetylglucosamine synthase-like glycosyltransferase